MNKDPKYSGVRVSLIDGKTIGYYKDNIDTNIRSIYDKSGKFKSKEVIRRKVVL